QSPPSLPHVPVPAAGGARPSGGADPPRGVLHERGRIPDEPGEHRRRRDRGRGARALPRHPHLVRRERHRLDRLRARPDGLRVGRPLPRSRLDDATERLLAPSVQGDVPVRSHRHQAHRRHRRRDADVGFGLSAPGRRVAGVIEVHRGAVRSLAEGRGATDHVRQCRAVLWPGEIRTGERTPMRTYSRISADSHIDMPWMPNDLFTSNASAALKDRMPYVTDGPDGPYWTCKNGMSFGLVCGVGPGGAKYVPGQNYRVEKMHAAGLYDDAKKGKR